MSRRDGLQLSQFIILAGARAPRPHHNPPGSLGNNRTNLAHLNAAGDCSPFVEYVPAGRSGSAQALEETTHFAATYALHHVQGDRQAAWRSARGPVQAAQRDLI